MGDNKKWTRRAAVGSLASGGGLLLFGTGGSTQITSHRDVAVNAAEGDDAILQFVDRSKDAGTVGDGAATVYEIRDNVGTFGSDEISVSARIDEDDIGAIDATVSDGSAPFEIDLRCSDETAGLRGEYTIELAFTASNADSTISADRTTDEPVTVDCGFDYGNSANYRDNTEDTTNTDIPPREAAKGSVTTPSNVNSDDGRYATFSSESRDDGTEIKGAEIGFVLPTAPKSDAYELRVEVSGDQPSGDWIVYLVDGAGTRLTSTGNGPKDKLKKNTNRFAFDSDESGRIRSNRTDLYLIFATTSNGNEVTAMVDHFELRPVSSSS